MIVTTAIRDKLLTDAAVKGLVAERIFPLQAPIRAAFPRLVYSIVAAEGVYSLTGDSGLRSARVQLDCQAKTYLAARELAEAVRRVLSGLRQVVGNSGPLFLQMVTEENDVDLFDPPVDGSDVGVFRVIRDFRVWY
jgi:hypothetical protein